MKPKVLKAGDWIRYTSTGEMGFIFNIDQEKGAYNLQLIRTILGNKINKRLTTHAGYIEPIEDTHLEGEDIQVMIDLALRDRDEESFFYWCKMLRDEVEKA